jgi:hypothetical protein
MTSEHIIFLIVASFEALKLIVPIGLLAALTYKITKI